MAMVVMASVRCSLLSSPTVVLSFRRTGVSTSSSFYGSVSPLRRSCRVVPVKESRRRGLIQVRAARMESTRLSIGLSAPNFELPEPLTGKVWKLDDFKPNPALLVMFICNHCPFVIHLKKDITKLTKFYMTKGLAAVAISSNSIISHPQDGPEFMAEDAKSFDYPFPYLFDATQEVARSFGAVCTPEFFLFKKDGTKPFELFYHGQFDDSRPSKNIPVTGSDLSRAIDCALSGQELPFEPKPSVGCSIKWQC